MLEDALFFGGDFFEGGADVELGGAAVFGEAEEFGCQEGLELGFEAGDGFFDGFGFWGDGAGDDGLVGVEQGVAGFAFFWVWLKIWRGGAIAFRERFAVGGFAEAVVGVFGGEGDAGEGGEGAGGIDALDAGEGGVEGDREWQVAGDGADGLGIGGEGLGEGGAIGE